MERQEFIQQISALRGGTLKLEAPGQNGLSRFACGMLYETKEYMAALECGYRALWYLLERNMGSVKAGETTLGELIRNQWSDEAALGYAYIAATEARLTPEQTVCLLESMGDAMSRYHRAYAAEVHQCLVNSGTKGRAARQGGKNSANERDEASSQARPCEGDKP